mmetsp:Transcript_8506/g.15621  ORF Transcript_8506/g.15621 Transcript_8506/m.15621 type:complete len:115 (+) Transcript_8506:247-591(+)
MLELLVACSLVALGSTTWLVYCAPAEPEPEPEHGIQSTTVTLHYQSIPMPVFNALFYRVDDAVSQSPLTCAPLGTCRGLGKKEKKEKKESKDFLPFREPATQNAAAQQPAIRAL